jgi:hypothetical protein
MDSSYMIPYIALLIVAIVIGKYITMWYHEIGKRNRYMETQIRLLSHIAFATGVSEDKVAEVVAGAKLPESEGKKLAEMEERYKKQKENKG